MNLPKLLPLVFPNDLNTPRHFHTNRKLRSAIRSLLPQLTSSSDLFFFLANIVLTDDYCQTSILKKSTQFKWISKARYENMFPEKVST